MTSNSGPMPDEMEAIDLDLDRLEHWLRDADDATTLSNRALAELLRRARRLEQLERFLREHGGLVLRALAIRGATHSLYARYKNAAAPEDAAHHALAALMMEINDGKP